MQIFMAIAPGDLPMCHKTGYPNTLISYWTLKAKSRESLERVSNFQVLMDQKGEDALNGDTGQN